MKRRRLFRLVSAAAAMATSLSIPIALTPAAPAAAWIPARSDFVLGIPEGAPAVTTGSMRQNAIEVRDQGTIVDVDVAIRINHLRAADLSIHVSHPDGTRVELTSNNGSGRDFGSGLASCSGALTVFDDDVANKIVDGRAPFVGRYRPEGLLAEFDTLPSAGQWALEVRDNLAPNWGAFYCFELRFTLSTGNTVVVTSKSDIVDATDGLVSLREAFEIAPFDRGPTTIILAQNAGYDLHCSNDVEDEDLNREGDLDLHNLSEQLTIEGNGSTISSGGCSGERMIDVSDIDTLTLRDVTLLGGHGQGFGGALGVKSANALTLDHVRVVRNTTAERRSCQMSCDLLGAVAAILVKDVVVRDSVIEDNRTTTFSCTMQCYGTGGMHIVGTNVSIVRTVVDGNLTEFGPETCTTTCVIRAAGVFIQADTARIESSSLTSNRATTSVTQCTGCSASGAVSFYTPGGSVIINSTLSDNVATSTTSQGGGVYRFQGPMQLSSSTIVDNTATDGANVYLATAETATISAAAIGAGDGASGCSMNTARVIADYSFDSGVDCGFPAATGNISRGGDPRVHELTADTPVRVPVAGSPLIDKVPVALCPGQPDQLGTKRPLGSQCDIGSIEAPLPPADPADPDDPADPADPDDPAGPADPDDPAGPDDPDTPATTATKFVPLPPARVFDTRDTAGAPGPKGFVAADVSIDVQVTGVAGVPASNVAAVVLNVTATESAGAGFVTVWPTGGPRPLASSLNLTAAGQTRANLVTVPVSRNGSVSLYTQSGAHLLGDIAGYYVTVTTPQSDGRVIGLAPTRLFDTRADEPAPGPKGLVGPNKTITVQVAGVAGVPASGATAVVLNITATEATRPGFVTAWPSGSVQPLASILNLNAAGDTAPNLVMIPLGADGTISLFASGGAHLLADVTGYVTGSNSPVDTAGLFVPLAPTRVFDTRPGEPAAGPKGRIAAGTAITTSISGVAGIPPDAAAVMINLTAADAGSVGFVTTWPTGQPRPLASTLNVDTGDTRPNAAIMPLPADGHLDHYAQPSTYLLADATGYFMP